MVIQYKKLTHSPRRCKPPGDEKRIQHNKTSLQCVLTNGSKMALLFSIDLCDDLPLQVRGPSFVQPATHMHVRSYTLHVTWVGSAVPEVLPGDVGDQVPSPAVGHFMGNYQL